MARRAAARKSTSRREAGAGARMRAEVRDHIIGVALGLFGLLSIVALFSSQGSVLEWWHSVMAGLLGWGAALVPLAFFVAAAIVWRRALARQLLLPGLGAVLVILALLGIVDVATGNGGWLGRTIGTASTNALGNVGGIIVLLAVFAIGIVIAANRTLQELARPALDRRPQFAFRPGTALPGGTAPAFESTAARPRPIAPPSRLAPEDEAPIKINMDQERPVRKPVKPVAQQEVLPIAAEPIAPP